MPPTDSSPASRALFAEVSKKVRELGIVIWLDTDSQYASFTDSLAQSGFAYPVVSLRGSYLELMLALEGYGNDLYPEKILVHLPGLNKEKVKETPVYELYKAGSVFEKNLATLIREAAVGLATPEALETFLKTPNFTLASADAWLASLRDQSLDEFRRILESWGPHDVALALITGDSRLTGHLPDRGDQLLEFLEKGLGLSAAWRAFRLGDASLTPTAMASLVASWIMTVEFVHDLKEDPVTPELRVLTKLGQFAKECRALAARFRQLHPDLYELFANEQQDALDHERTSHLAGALGSIDTFRFEEGATRAAAIGALCRAAWDEADSFASARTAESCFWVRRSQALQRTWELIRLAAQAGQALAANQNALAGCASLEEAIERYRDRLAGVDRHHRVFEQRMHALLASDLEDYDALLEVRQAVRRAYRDWANATNRAFFDLCTRRGPLPDPSLRQRTVYEQVVHPLIESGERVAFFLVDALRFEMAQALALDLKRDKYQVNLAARLAELPSDTVIGMNALAPVERGGRLRLLLSNGHFDGFRAGESSVRRPSDRIAAMSQRSLTGTAEDIELEEFQELSLPALKRRLHGKPNLVVVRSRELDTAGEHGLHLGTFEQTLALLKSALSLLQQAGVEHFILSSDHGFLLQDTTVESVPFGPSKREPRERYALLSQPSGKTDVLELPLSALDYDVDHDQYLVLAADTTVWRTDQKATPFVHGGNSLQERVIPVLVMSRRAARGKTTSKYEVVAKAQPARLGRQRLQLAVRLQTQSSAALSFHAPREIALALRIPGRMDVTIGLVSATPPASLGDGRILLPPNKDAALIEFELEGKIDEKVRVEVYHPDAREEVTPKLVDGFFDVARDRRERRPKGETLPPPPASDRAPKPQKSDDWGELITDPAYRRVLQIIAERRTINEQEMQHVLGNARRVRMFARHFDDLVRLVPFEIEVLTVNGMKAYTRKD